LKGSGREGASSGVDEEPGDFLTPVQILIMNGKKGLTGRELLLERKKNILIKRTKTREIRVFFSLPVVYIIVPQRCGEKLSPRANLSTFSRAGDKLNEKKNRCR